MKKDNEKRGKVTSDNREWLEEYMNLYNGYIAAKSQYQSADDDYKREKDRYRTVEMKCSVTGLHEYEKDDGSRRLGNEDGSGIYQLKYHRILREPSDIREDKAYE